jgi:DNA-binding protein HU-beta
LGDLVGLITKHLKKGERIRIAGLAFCKLESACRKGAILQPGSDQDLRKKVAFRAAKDLKPRFSSWVLLRAGMAGLAA